MRLLRTVNWPVLAEYASGLLAFVVSMAFVVAVAWAWGF